MRWYAQLLHIGGIAMTIAVVWYVVIRQKYGTIVFTVTERHGLHEGDIPVILIGGAIVMILTTRLLRRSE